MSTCPVMMLSHLAIDSTTPSSPPFSTRLHKLPSSSLATTSTPPSSPGPMCKMPSIATHTTPPSPTSSRVMMTLASPPSSPRCRKMKMVLPNVCSMVTTTPPTPTKVPSNSRLQPVARAMSASKSGKRKLGPGCGLLDWIRLCRSKTDLAGNGGEMTPITIEELAKHNTETDAWTAIRGKVYNLTYYMKFHPGGKDELMRGAGIDCTILFDQVHKWVNVESTLKACYVGPLKASSPGTQRRNSANIVKKVLRHRDETLAVPKTVIITDGMNKQAVSVATRKNSMTLRNETQAATACEEHDGLRQISPESPIKPLVGEAFPRKLSTTTHGAASNSASITLNLPPTRIRRTSEPHPRYDWVQSEKAVTIHILTQNVGLKPSDVVLDVNGKTFEAAVFIYDWVFELRIDLAHGIVGSQVNINCGRVEISLKKEVPHVQWETIGTRLDGNCKLSTKSKRGTKYHTTRIESIQKVTHDTKLFTLRLPVGSYLNVPTGHHLSIKANIDGEDVERSYTPVSALEAAASRHVHPATQQDGETIDLMVKLYRDGKMSRFLSQLKEGDEVVVSDSEGSFDGSSRLKSASDILLIAAGSGFTPMVKILRDFLSTELVSRPRITSASEASGESGQDDQLAPELPPAINKVCDRDDEVTVKLPKSAKLLFANKKERDIMYKEELHHLARATNERFKATHILSEANGHWEGLKGRIGETLLRSSLPLVNPKNRQATLVCVCGPEPFLANISNLLLDMEFPDECIQCFQ